jgi:mono/diheme cytochrome c family protein
MSNTSRSIVLTAWILALIAPVASSSRAEDAPAGDAVKGKRIYMAVGCFECHGRFGQGGDFKGPAPSIAHTELPLDAFTMQLRQPAENMPTYAEAALPEKDVADIFAYVQSLPGLRDLKTLPEILTH